MGQIDNKSVQEQQIQILEQQKKYADELRDTIKKSTDELTELYCGLIGAKAEFEKIKKENLDEIRRYKLAISTEANIICSDIKRITDSVPKEGMSNLGKFIDACERLQELRKDGFFDAIRGI